MLLIVFTFILGVAVKPSRSDGIIDHYGFETVNLNTIYDESGVDNNALLVNGAHLNKQEAKCGASVELAGGEITLNGDAFKNKPEHGISVAMWVKLNKEVENVIFFAVKPSLDGEGATYVFEVKDGKIHWSHTGSSLDTIFDVLTVQRSTVPEGLWTHLAATYNTRTRHAKLYVDTQLIMTESGSGKLSTDWRGKVAIGADGTLPGYVDEFYMYDKAISLSDVKDLSELCNLNADYPIPMENGAYTGLIPEEQVQEMKDRLSGKQNGNRHSAVDNQSDDEGSDDDGSKTPKCRKDAIIYGSDLRGGKNSGLFYEVGKVSDVNECIMHCCETARCDLAYMDDRKCFAVICHFPSLCQPIKSDNKRLTIGYIERDSKSVYEPDLFPTEPSIQKTTKKTTTATTVKRRSCLQSMVYYGVALRGGWTAGKFTDMGLVRNLQECVGFCCNDTSCDLSMVLSKRCYKVHCYNLADCQTTAAGHAQIAYVSREDPKVAQPTQPSILNNGGPPTVTHITKPVHQASVTFSPTITTSVPEMACHLSFDKINEDKILDDSRYGNDATLSNGANISPGGGIRGNGVVLFGGDVLLDGEDFRPKPRKAITIAMWVKLSEKDGAHSLFDTIGSHSSHNQGQYHFEIIDGKVHWFHRDEVARVIFSVTTSPAVSVNEWTHVAATYDSDLGEAKVYVNGELIGAGDGHGLLSLDWGAKAGFGTHTDGRALLGYIDDIYIYTKAMTKPQIRAYVGNYKEKNKLESFFGLGNSADANHPPGVTNLDITSTTTTTTSTTPTTTITTPTTTATTPTTQSTTSATTTTNATTATTQSSTTPTTTTQSSTTPIPVNTTTRPPTTTTATQTTPETTTEGKATTICNIGDVYQNSDLKGGLQSGNFLDRGISTGVLQCMELCCLMPTCDLAYMVSGRCYLVECFSKELCQVIPKGVSALSPTIGLISRPDQLQTTPTTTTTTTTLPTTAITTTAAPLAFPSNKNIPKPPMTLQQINELASQLQNPDVSESDKNRPVVHPETCIYGAVLDHTALVGGLRAGNFSHQGLTDSMEVCQRRCCNIETCDLAIMMKGACFAVSCRKKALCKPRKAHLASYSLLLSYRKRPGVDLSFEYEHPNAAPTVASTTTETTLPVTTSVTHRETTTHSTKTQTTTKPTVKTTIQDHQGKTTPTAIRTNGHDNNSDVETVDLPKKPGVGIQSWCTTDFILEGVKLAGGLHSGTYHVIGRLDDINACVQRCCDTRDCTTAYIDRGTCYAFKCLDKDLCKSAIADSRSSVGYVIRDGWTLFKSAKEALSGAILSVQPTSGLHLQLIHNQTTEHTADVTLQPGNDNSPSGLVVSGKGQSKSVNGSNPTPPPNVTPGSLLKPLSPIPILPHPSHTQGTNFGYCERGKTIINSRLIGGLGAGNFTDHGIVSDIETCTEYCCRDRECDLAYLIEETCYTVHCHNKELCKTFKAPGALYNPILSFVSRNASEFIHGDRKGGIGNKLQEGTSTLHLISETFNNITPQKNKTTPKHLQPQENPESRPHPTLASKKKHKKHKSKSSASGKHPSSKKHKAKLNLHSKPKKHKGKKPARKAKKAKKKEADQNKLHQIFDELMSDVESGSGVASHLSIKSSKQKAKHHSKRKGRHRKLKLKATKRPIFAKTKSSAVLPLTTRVPIPLSKVDVATIESLSEDAPGELDRCPAREFGCEHFCVSLNHGGHRCMCHMGYRLSLDGRHCLEQEECDARSHRCEQYCIFEDGTFRCQCRSGFILNIINNTCDDIDECSIGINGCDQDCVNTPGSYRCVCAQGYRLSDDQMTCEDLEFKGKVSKKDTVVKTPRFSIPATIVKKPNNTYAKPGRSVILDCIARGHPLPKIAWAAGYLHHGPLPNDTRFVVLPEGSLLIQNLQAGDQGLYRCIAINVAGADAAEALLRVEEVDECQTQPQRCGQICKKSLTGYTCGCYRGYTLTDDNHTCEDTDECSLNYHRCSHYCFNTQGSYVCGCKIGYRLGRDRRSCDDIDECKEGLHSCPQSCNNTNGSYKCQCFKGFELQNDSISCQRIVMPTINDKHQVLFSVGFSAMVSISIVLTGTLVLTLLVLIKNYKKRLKFLGRRIAEDHPVNNDVEPVYPTIIGET